MVPSSDGQITFKFIPTPGRKQPRFLAAFEDANPLGPLSDLLGKWEGGGFNVVWRPVFNPSQDRFLELNLTKDSFSFDNPLTPIPNRGLLQEDMVMSGLTYSQAVFDVSTGLGLHIEPGIWAVAPSTSHPKVDQTVIRMASIPHGTAILAQGKANTITNSPIIPPSDIRPFPIGNPAGALTFNEQNLAISTEFRTPPNELQGIQQSMLDDPNSILRAAIKNQEILSATILEVSTRPDPVPGGGCANTAFLMGEPPTENSPNPNAVVAEVRSIFWIETVKGTPDFLQLQYSQVVLLNFNGLSWPHVSVGTLLKNVPPAAK